MNPINRSPLLSKILMIGLLALLLLIPLSMIESKISERQMLQNQVQQDIARSASGPQTLTGPYLVISYKLRGLAGSSTYETVLTPHSLKIDGNADVETRNRGIYQARLFNLRSTITGDFAVPQGYGINKPVDDIIPQAAYFVMAVSDARGIRNAPQLTLNGISYEFEPGSVKPISGNGIRVPVPIISPAQTHNIRFDFPLDLQGMNTLAVSPSGNRTEMLLKSFWPHPSFGGSFLPRTRNVEEKGFSAQWLVTNLARNTNEQTGTVAAPETFSVGFIDPVNVYLLSERAVKYGVMFVILVFTAFFMFEVLRNLRIHPMQYLLVGLAMAMFFLLIISLSEHIPFLAAYSVSGTACVALIGVYLAGVLKNRKPALNFSGGIALLYTVLYGVLQSEDNALLMGSLLMFSALAAVMLLTRRMDWYQLNSTSEAR